MENQLFDCSSIAGYVPRICYIQAAHVPNRLLVNVTFVSDYAALRTIGLGHIDREAKGFYRAWVPADVPLHESPVELDDSDFKSQVFKKRGDAEAWIASEALRILAAAGMLEA